MIADDAFAGWLGATVSRSPDGRYWHVLLEEEATRRPLVLPSLRKYVTRAHEEARRRYQDILGSHLDPVTHEASGAYPLYPARLHPKTLKAYLGEILAGLAVEVFGAFGEKGWKVPAYFFRLHDKVFDQLEELRLFGTPPKDIFGHSGDDCLAFRRDAEGRITHCLVCEAKCTQAHRTRLVDDAHRKLSTLGSVIARLWRIIEVLQSRCDGDPDGWITSLQALTLSEPVHTHEQCDAVCYACGSHPSDPQQATWIPTDRPNPNYTGQHRLQAVEIHLHGVNALVKSTYAADEEKNG